MVEIAKQTKNDTEQDRGNSTHLGPTEPSPSPPGTLPSHDKRKVTKLSVGPLNLPCLSTIYMKGQP